MSERVHPFDVRDPIDASSVLLEASAGTGKTYGIASIFLRMVIDADQTRGPDRPSGVAPREILLVTFTRAATAEMRSRIRARCRDARDWLVQALEDPEGTLPPTEDPAIEGYLRGLPETGRRDALRRALGRVEEAVSGFDEITIATIHGFCQRMLTRNALESGVPLDATVGEEASEVPEEVARDAYRRFRQQTPLLPWKAALVSFDQGDSFWPLWQGVSRELAAHPEGSIHLGQAPMGPISEDLESWQRTFEALLGDMVEAIQALPDDLPATLVDWKSRGILHQGHVSPDLLASLPAVLQTARDHRSLPVEAMDLPFLQGLLDLLGRTLQPTAKGLKQAKPPPDPNCLSVLQRWKDLKERWGTTINHPVIRGLVFQGLRDLERALRTEVPARKRRHRVWTYDDLILALRQRLEGPGSDRLVAAIRQQFRVALIDEFQDTDANQWAIFRRLFLDGPQPLRLWLVGDAKQSIYRFRGADIRAYLEARQEIRTRRSLTVNRRSDGPLMAFLNRLWSYPGRDPEGQGEAMMLPFLEPAIPAPRVEAFHDLRRMDVQNPTQPGCYETPVRIARIGVRSEGPDASSDAEAPLPANRARSLASRWAAADVARFLQAGVRRWEKAGSPPEPVRPRDVAVLVRTHREGQLVQRAFQRLGVLSVRQGTETVFETPEARELALLLQCLLRPGHPSSVATAMSLPLFQQQATDVDRLWHDPQTWQAWSQRLIDWRDHWDRGGIWHLWWSILEHDPSPLGLLSSWGGERTITNWFHLVEWLQGEATRDHLGPLELVQRLQRMIDHQGKANDDPDTRLIRLESDLDAVQIVTIHTCKGLQYPFVWAPFLWGVAPAGGGDWGFWMDWPSPPDPGPQPDSEGPGRSPSGPFRKVFIPRVAKDQVAREEFEAGSRQVVFETLQEQLRLAYVAMTRPMHGLSFAVARTKDFGGSPLGIVLHGHRATPLPEGPEAQERIKKQIGALKSSEIQSDLENLERLEYPDEKARNPQGQTSSLPVARVVEAWIEVVTPATGDAGEATAPLEARRFTRPRATLDRSWVRSSYSGLIRGSREAEGDSDEASGPADDEPEESEVLRVVADRSAPTSTASGVPSPLEGLPGGRLVGDMAHAVLEILDFRQRDPAHWRQVAHEACHRFGLPEEAADRLAGGLPAILETPLGGFGSDGDPGPCLGDLGRRDTLRELAFHLPVRGGILARPGSLVTPGALREALRIGAEGDPVMEAYRPALDRLSFPGFHGDLEGAIDLVYRWQPPGAPEATWYLADYKTNRLGDRETADHLGHYGPDEMLAEMVRAHYVLQYHLYLVALHRYLSWRLPGYDYDRHVGGVRYLFLRGMGGRDHGGRTGVFRDRPPKARIEALDRLFASSTEEGGSHGSRGDQQ